MRQKKPMEFHKKKLNLGGSLLAGVKLKKTTTRVRERGRGDGIMCVYTIGENGEKIPLTQPLGLKKKKRITSQYIYDEKRQLWTLNRCRTFPGKFNSLKQTIQKNHALGFSESKTNFTSRIHLRFVRQIKLKFYHFGT